jgi:hypothetical protein
MLAHRALTMLLVCSACGGSDRRSPGLDGGPGTSEEDASTERSVCADKTENNPVGLKEVKYLDSSETVYPEADWRIALEPETDVNWATFDSAQPVESVMLLDLADSSVEMAGFLVSRNAAASTAVGEANVVQVALNQLVAGVSEISTRVSGTNITSLDGYDTVVGMTLEIQTSGITDATELRERILPALLGRAPGELTFPDVGWQSGADNRFAVSMQVLHRADADQALLVGSVTRAFDFDARNRTTGMHADDLANGSNVTVSINGEAKECEDELLDKQAVSDIIWVVDQSGSTDNDRDRIAENADEFFQKALDLGLDFRMAVTDMDDASLGKFATRDADDSDERWIQPNEPALFSAAINDPSGPAGGDFGSENGLMQLKAAIENHTPRSADDALMVRPDAKLAILLVTDEKPEEFKDDGILSSGNNEPTAEQHDAMMIALTPYREALAAEDAVMHVIAEPLPFTDTVCSGPGAEHGFGYYELATESGGQIADICQENLGATLDVMLDAIVGDASPIELEYVPISSSITVMRDLVVVPRSRELGWDYRGSSNTIVFYGMPVDPAHPANITIGYRRWEEQVVE